MPDGYRFHPSDDPDHPNDINVEIGGNQKEPPPDGDPAGTPAYQTELARLAALSPVEYDQAREKASKALGIRVGTLDKLVADLRSKAAIADEGDVVEDLQPWAYPVHGGDLLNDVRADFGRHVIADPESLDAAALWTLGTFCFDAFSVWAKLFVSSPERRCGKTVLLDVLEANSCRALMASSITASAVFRAVNEWRPTLIIDEADRLPKDNEELIGIINAGHRKRSAIVIRSVKVGEEFIPRKFSVWAPMALAAIGRMADTIMDRSILIHMRRKAPGERAEKVPGDLFERNQVRRSQALRWAADNLELLRNTQVRMPPHGNDRAIDNWAPLFSIATVVGSGWPARVLSAFAKLTVEEEGDEAGPMLLADIREVFEGKAKVTKLASQILVDELVAMEGRPWCEWRHGRPITQNTLSRMLRPYKIGPAKIRVGTATPNGYQLEQFRDAWRRYLPDDLDTPVQSGTVEHPYCRKASDDSQSGTPKTDVPDAKTREPYCHNECSGVPLSRGEHQGTHAANAVEVEL